MAQYIIPTVFTATDRLSRPVLAMQNAVRGLGQAGAAASTGLNSVGNILGEQVHQRLQFMLSLGKSLAIVGVVSTAAKSLLDYDTALTKFRVIVSDLNAADFSKFKKSATDIANATKASSIEVVNMFTAIAGLDDRLASTPEKLARVTQAAIMMQRGGFMEADAAARSLVTTLSQFNYDVSQSERVINAFAAGQNRGAFTINQTSEALVNFGATAKAANMQVEDAVGTLQALAASGIQAAEAGTALNAVILRIQASGRGYKSGKFNFMEGLQEIKTMTDKLNPRAKDAAIKDIFGVHRMTEASFLLDHIKDIERFTVAATGTKEASIAAGIANQSLSQSLKNVVNSFVTYLTSGAGAASVTGKIASAARFLSDNMNTILNVAVPLIKIWAYMRVVLLANTLVIKAWNVAAYVYNARLGVSIFLNGQSTLAIEGNTAAMAGFNFMTKMVNASLATWAMRITAGIGLWIGLLYLLAPAKDATAEMNANLDTQNKMFSALVAPMDAATLALGRYNEKMAEYNSFLAIKTKKEQSDKEMGRARNFGESFNIYNRSAMDRFKYYTTPTVNEPSKTGEATGLSPADSSKFMGFPSAKPDSSNVVLPTGQPTSSVFQPETTLNVFVTQDKSGQWGATLESKTGTGIPVIVKQTGGSARTA